MSASGRNDRDQPEGAGAGMLDQRARWALALRIARREVRRHPWRHALVVVLILVPVLAALVGFTALATFDHVGDREARFERGGAPTTVFVTSPRDDRGAFASLDEVVAALPPGTPVSDAWNGGDWFLTDTGRTPGPDAVPLGTSTWSVPSDGRLDASYVVARGRLPRSAEEVFLSRALAADGGWTVGDRVTSARTGRSFTVVGLGERGNDHGRRDAVVSDAVDPSYWTTGTADLDVVRGSDGDRVSSTSSRYAYVGLPAADVVRHLDDAHLSTPIRGGQEQADDRVLAGLTLGAGFLAALVAVVTSTAFAIGSRQQLRQIGLLATAGADPAVVRRTLVLQGAVPGAIAGALATALVVVGARVVERSPRYAEAVGVTGAEVTVPGLAALGALALAVGAGVLAAWQPARTAARLPLLTALSGRRPAPPIQRRLPLTGLVLVVVGMAVLALWSREGSGTGLGDTTSNGWGFLLPLGGAAAFAAGAIALAPALVALTARLGGRARGTTRLALRGLARHRAQSAACVAAVAVSLALPVAVQTDRAADHHDRPVWPEMDVADRPPVERLVAGEHPVVATLSRDATAAPDREDLAARLQAVLGPRAVPVTTFSVPQAEGVYVRVATVDAARAADVLVPAAARALVAGRAIDLRWDEEGIAPQLLSVGGLQATPLTAATELGDVEAFGIDGDLLVSTDVAAASTAGRPPIGTAYLRSRSATPAEERAIFALNGWATTDLDAPTVGQIQAAVAATEAGTAGSTEQDPWVWLESGFVAQGEDTVDPWELLLWLGPVALALLVLTITLSLRSVDGRDDRRIALAVGAPPRRIRHQQAVEGVVLALLGAFLALPLGWLPVTAVRLGRRVPTSPDGTATGLGDASLLDRLWSPGWGVVPVLLLPAVAAAVLWVVVPGLRALADRRATDQLLPQA